MPPPVPGLKGAGAQQKGREDGIGAVLHPQQYGNHVEIYALREKLAAGTRFQITKQRNKGDNADGDDARRKYESALQALHVIRHWQEINYFIFDHQPEIY